MKNKEIMAFFCGYTLATTLDSDHIVKLAQNNTRKSNAAQIEFGFELGIDFLCLVHLGCSYMLKHKYQRAFAIGYVLATTHCLLKDLFFPDPIDTRSSYETRKYFIMENKTFQVIFGLLNLSVLLYSNYRYNKDLEEYNNVRERARRQRQRQRQMQQPERRDRPLRIRIEGIQGRSNQNQQQNPTRGQQNPQIPIAFAINSNDHQQDESQTDYAQAPIAHMVVPSAPPAPLE
jgi:hypothetical protein